jgi:4-hydroxysphinganine ceramide fatty acyl 2-hydroxylase
VPSLVVWVGGVFTPQCSCGVNISCTRIFVYKRATPSFQSMSRVFTRTAVSKHNTHKDCWVILGNNVYDVTDFLDSHPGGDDFILEHAGGPVDHIMADPDSHEHSKVAYDMMKEFHIGRLLDARDVQGNEDSEFVQPNDFRPSETDAKADYQINHFLSLDEPLIPQMLNKRFTKQFYLEQVHIPRHKKTPARLMPYDFLEMFTMTPWYIVPMLWLPIAAGFLYKSVVQYNDIFKYNTSLLGTVAPSLCAFGGYALGIFIWTFLEYLFHRFLFHMDDMLPEGQIFYLMHFLLHGIHHFLPMDHYRLVMPPVMFATLSFPMLFVAHAVFPAAMANSVIAGSYTMYVGYDTIHYALHHTRLPSYLREMKRYHLEHHYKNYDLGFGVTNKLWDYVFHTVLK